MNMASSSSSTSSSSKDNVWANEQDISSFNSAWNLLNLINTNDLPMIKKRNVEQAKADLAAACNAFKDVGTMERIASLQYTNRVRTLLGDLEEHEFQIEPTLSVQAVKDLLNEVEWPLEQKESFYMALDSMDTSTPFSKKKSIEAIRAFLEPPNSEPPDLQHSTTGQPLERLSSMEILRGVLSFTAGNTSLDRKASLEVFKNLLARPQQKPMASYNSFRFEKLAKSIHEVERDLQDIDEEDYSEYVVSVDTDGNLDGLLDDRPYQQPFANIYPPAGGLPPPPPPPGAIQQFATYQLPSMYSTTAAMPNHMYSPTHTFSQQVQVYPQSYAPPPVGLQQQVDNQQAPLLEAAKFCATNGCNNLTRTKGFCKAHGGGRRCKIEGCSKSAQTGHLCIAHGGGKPCKADNCTKTAQSRGMCKAHGGGVRCKAEGCPKSCQSGGYCRGHGGGKRCTVAECKKWAQRNGLCAKHASVDINI